MKKLYEEFKEFAFSGDIVALAVAFVMAGAFAAVVAALVDNVVMPIVSLIIGKPTFDSLYWEIHNAIVPYGAFITALVRFLAIAIGVFFFIIKPYKAYQNMKKQPGGETEAEAPSVEDERVALLREIRDALNK